MNPRMDYDFKATQKNPNQNTFLVFSGLLFSSLEKCKTNYIHLVSRFSVILKTMCHQYINGNVLEHIKCTTNTSTYVRPQSSDK